MSTAEDKFRIAQLRKWTTDALDLLPGDRNRPLAERLRLPLMLGGPLVVILVGGFFYLTGGRYVTTDDAYLAAARVSVSTSASGRIVEILVKDNQRVTRGQVLFRMDTGPAIIAAQEAQAQLAAVRLNVEALKASYRQKQAELQGARDTFTFQSRELVRQKSLLASGISSKSQYDQASHAVDIARQQVDSVQQQIASVLASLGGEPDIPVDQHPSVLEASARSAHAMLNLSYMTVQAPLDGIVTKVEQIQVGDYVQEAMPVFSLVSGKVWVEANFKETDLTHMRPGQPATVTLDAYPGHKLRAEVETLSPGTGSAFSLLPPENATGNWVKVVQRLTVRIKLLDVPPALALHIGLSADVSVDTGYHLPFASDDEPISVSSSSDGSTQPENAQQ